MNPGATAASSPTSPSLLDRVRRQEPEAWDRFARIYGPLVYRWCLQRGANRHDAADVVQEVFRAVLGGIARFQRESSGESLRGWLWTITRNKVCDHFRRRADEPRADGGSEALAKLAQAADPIPADDENSLAGDVAELAHRALTLIQTEFEATTWQAFWAMAVDGLSAAEAARRCGITQAAAYKAKSRVLNRLRCELDGMVD